MGFATSSRLLAVASLALFSPVTGAQSRPALEDAVPEALPSGLYWGVTPVGQQCNVYVHYSVQYARNGARALDIRIWSDNEDIGEIDTEFRLDDSLVSGEPKLDADALDVTLDSGHTNSQLKVGLEKQTRNGNSLRSIYVREDNYSRACEHARLVDPHA